MSYLEIKTKYEAHGILPWGYSLIIRPDEFGKTQRSLDRTVVEVMARWRQKVALVPYITGGGFLAGFLIFDPAFREVIMTGDGFRLDGGGEGGRGTEKINDVLQVLFGWQDFLNSDAIPFRKKDALELSPISDEEIRYEEFRLKRIATGISYVLQKYYESEKNLSFFVPRAKMSY